MQIEPDKEEQRLAEEVKFLRKFLDHFETHIYPLYGARGYSRNTALTSYSIITYGGEFEPPTTLDSDETWKG